MHDEQPMPLRISVHAPAGATAREAVDAGLDAHNQAFAPLGDVRALHVLAENDAGQLVGGAIGRTWGRCCELQQIWVDSTLRRAGVGSRLMAAFEAEAQARGCELVYLDTFSFQAPAFYLRRGYEEALRIEGYTGGAVKYTLHKTLGAKGAAHAG